MSIDTTASIDSFESAHEDLNSICPDDPAPGPQPAPLLTRDQEILRNHSFQLVKLQNDLCELRDQQAKDLRTTTRIMAQMADLYASIAELKGKLAGMTVELHMLQDAALSNLLSGGGIEELADCIMKEQRESLIRALREATIRRKERSAKREDKAPETPPQEPHQGFKNPFGGRIEEMEARMRDVDIEGSSSLDAVGGKMRVMSI